MKKLSGEIKRNYIILMILFFISSTVFVLITKRFLDKEMKRDLYTIRNFLLEEFKEPQHLDLEKFFNDAIDESPRLQNLYIKLSNKKAEYSLPEDPNLKGIKESNKIQDIDNRYFVIKDKALNVKGEPIIYTITKDSRREDEFSDKMLRAYIISNLLLIVACGIASRMSYKRIVRQSKKLIEATHKVNLDSFEADVDKESFFEEFYMVIASYEEMLKRINDESRAQIEFIHNASHELKTPLFIIIGYIDLIKRWGLEEKEVALESIGFIDEEANNMKVLLEKLLFLAKDRKVQLDIEKFSLEELVMESIKDMAIIYQNQSFEVSLEEVEICSDYNLLKMLIRNLLENSVKYGEEGTIDINLKVSEGIELTIKDRGIGMSSETLENIYNKFYRGEKGRSKEIKGYGLGMSIVKIILQRLDGTIEIKSKLGKGTEIKVFLPKNLHDDDICHV